MTKRIHNFGEKYSKKPKLDDDIDALWGDDDDIDESALDNCIKLATQVLEDVCWSYVYFITNVTLNILGKRNIFTNYYK